MTTVSLDTASMADYRKFLSIRKLPSYRITGHSASFPDEYAEQITGKRAAIRDTKFTPLNCLFDYQRDIAAMAVQKRKYCCFVDCGFGKTLIMLEFARHCAEVLKRGKAVLIVSPLMVIPQTIAEAMRFYGDDLPIEQVRASELGAWMQKGGRIGITNYEALSPEIPQGRLGALLLDESSMLKSMYGHYGAECLRLGAGLDWKLALTGTPAPNDRIEYANHACFMDQFRTTNEFLARYFINRGQTDNRWEIRPHALRPFYRDLSHWAIFLTNPAVYGWKDNCATIPPINVHIHHVELTDSQTKAVRDLTGGLFMSQVGGITSRQKLSRIAKGKEGIVSAKPEYIRGLIESWPEHQTMTWCLYNDEQDGLANMFPDAGNISGNTPMERRAEIIAAFKSGEIRHLISKPKILGFGLNMQHVTKMVFSGLQDSYESYYQAVKRANRVGSSDPLDVHIPVTEVEVPMVETVLTKAKRVSADAAEQERMFCESRWKA